MIVSRVFALLIIVAATLWIGSGVLGRTDDPAKSTATPQEPAERPPFQVAVFTVNAEDHARGLVLSGHTEADDRARAVARTRGSIVELDVRRGDWVEKGDALATLSDEAREAQVAQAEAMLQKRQADIDIKLKLIERGIVPANDKNQLQADLRAAEAALAAARAEHERGVVRAPIAGMVSNVPVTRGEALQPDDVVAEIIALDPMLAIVEVAERRLGNIAVGDRAKAHLVTGQIVEGIVRYVSPTGSPGTRTYRVEVELDNSDHTIADGVTAEVEFRLAPVAAVRVPRSALTFSAAGELSLRTVGDDDIVATVPVSIVEDDLELVWVSGPADGTTIIVQGHDFVADGQKVAPVPVEGTRAAPDLISRS